MMSGLSTGEEDKPLQNEEDWSVEGQADPDRLNLLCLDSDLPMHCCHPMSGMDIS